MGSVIVPISASINSSPQTYSTDLSKSLGIKWWNWLFSIPPSKNPILDDNPCNVKQSEAFFYLIGTLGGSAERDCTIPKGKSIFFPIINVCQTLYRADDDFDTIEEVRKTVTDNIDQAHDLNLSVGGININTDNLRAQSKLFPLHIGADNILGAPLGTYYTITDGYWLALKPLSVGEHEISFSGEGADGFSLEVVYHITVK